MSENNLESASENPLLRLSEVEEIIGDLDNLDPGVKNRIVERVKEEYEEREKQKLYKALKQLVTLQSESRFSETDDNTFHQAVYFINKVSRFEGQSDELLEKGVFYAACHIFAFDSWFYFDEWKKGLKEKVEKAGVSESVVLDYCRDRLLSYAEENDLPPEHIEELGEVLDSAEAFRDRFYPEVQEAVLSPLHQDINERLLEVNYTSTNKQ